MFFWNQGIAGLHVYSWLAAQAREQVSDSRERAHFHWAAWRFLPIFTISSKMIQKTGQFLLLASLKRHQFYWQFQKVWPTRKWFPCRYLTLRKTFFFLFLTPELGKCPLSTSLSDDCKSEHGSKDKGGDEKVICLQNASINSELNHVKVCKGAPWWCAQGFAWGALWRRESAFLSGKKASTFCEEGHLGDGDTGQV